MSVSEIQNPNGLAATFDLGQDFINPYGKIIIPRGDAIINDVQIASTLLDLSKAFHKIDLTHHDSKGTVLTVNVAGFTRKTNPNFEWNQKRRDAVQSIIRDFMVSGIPPVNIQEIQKKYNASDLFRVNQNDTHAVEFLNKVNEVLKIIASNHGGDFEVLDLQDDTPNENGRILVDVVVCLFGACGGCSDFDSTYGQAADAINQLLSKDNPYKVDYIVKDDSKATGLVYNRLIKPCP